MKDDAHNAPHSPELPVMKVHVFWKPVFAGPHEAEILRRFDMELRRLPFDDAVARLRNEDIWKIMVLSESEAFRVIQEVEAAGMRAKLFYE